MSESIAILTTPIKIPKDKLKKLPDVEYGGVMYEVYEGTEENSVKDVLETVHEKPTIVSYSVFTNRPYGISPMAQKSKSAQDPYTVMPTPPQPEDPYGALPQAPEDEPDIEAGRQKGVQEEQTGEEFAENNTPSGGSKKKRNKKRNKKRSTKMKKVGKTKFVKKRK